MKKKIWLMNHYATDMFMGKSGRHYWFAKKLEDNGYFPTVFCANTYHHRKGMIDTLGKKYKVEYDGSTPFVFVRTTPSVGNGIDRLLNIFLFFINLLSAARLYAKKEGSPDVIIASSVHPLTMVAGILIAKRLKVPCICEVRDLWPEAIFFFGKTSPRSILGKAMILGEHWIYRKANALIFLKEGDSEYIREKGWDIKQGGDIDLNKCHYINNGVNIKAFEKLIKEETIDDVDLNNKDLFKVVYVGMIRPVNNVGNLIDCAKLLQVHKDIKILVYGDGSQFEELKGRAKDENINNIEFKGFIERNKIPYILSKSSVNILNYSQTKYNWKRGNSSNKLFEYMASGRPIISTVKMGYCIISKYNCGLTVDECTPKALADAILRIKNLSVQEYQKLCENARLGAREFDFDLLTQKLINVIHTVL